MTTRHGSDKPFQLSPETLNDPSLRLDQIRSRVEQQQHATTSNPESIDPRQKDHPNQHTFEDSINKSILAVFPTPEGSSRKHEERLTNSSQTFLIEHPLQKSSDQQTSLAIENFRRSKDIRPLGEQDIAAKNESFNARYETIIKQESNDHGQPIEGAFVVKVVGKREKNPYTGAEPDYDNAEVYYKNTINLKELSIKGWDNNKFVDIYENGKTGRMPLSDIKYQSLRRLSEWLKKTDDTSAIPYKDFSLSNFEPQILRGRDIEEKDSFQVIKNVLRTYRDAKEKKNEPLTSEEENKQYFFPKGSPEFEQIMLTPIGKEKIFFTGNYFSHLNFSGVHVTDKHERSITSIVFDLEKKE